MIFPIGDEQVKGGHKPIVSYSLLVLNALAFAWQLSDPTGGNYIERFGSIPNEIINGIDLHTILTSMFMHADGIHLAGNLLFLWIFADNVEATIGSWKFLLFYLLGGAFASYAHISLDPDSLTPCIGASGAIAAAMGAYLVMFPKSQIKMIVLIYFRVFYLSAYIVLGIWIGLQLVSGIGGLAFLSGGEGTDGGGIAYWAHIGGFVFGVLAGFYFKKSVNSEDDFYFEEAPSELGRTWTALD